MPLTVNQRLFERCENLWDSPVQWAVMRMIVDSEDARHRYAYPSRNRMARVLGRDRRYVLRVIEELETVKEAVQRIGVDRGKGPRNRYVITLERAIAKARREAGVGADVPLWEWPSRSAVRKRLADGGDPRTPLGESAPQRLGFDVGHREGSQDPPGRDPSAPPGGIPGSPLIFSSSSLDLHNGAADAAAHVEEQHQLPGLLGDALSSIHTEIRAAARRRQSRLYHRVAAKGREVLAFDQERQAALNSGAPIATYEDFVAATKRHCAQHRVKGYGEVVHKACVSEWWKRQNVMRGRG